MKALLDTHFLLWLVAGAPRLQEYDWLPGYRPWGVSPLSLLEVHYLAERGRLRVDATALREAIDADPWFHVDDPPLLPVCRHAFELSWTRDPFDRLLAGHSLARRVPLITADRRIRQNHAFLPPELPRLG